VIKQAATILGWINQAATPLKAGGDRFIAELSGLIDVFRCEVHQLIGLIRRVCVQKAQYSRHICWIYLQRYIQPIAPVWFGIFQELFLCHRPAHSD
jgi:hypothetical protein